MAILRSGILGRASGKVAGIVGAHWKDKSYVREYVIPSNPDTPLQQAQRTKMRLCVAFIKACIGQIFNKYVDKFERSMSGFNKAISENIAYCAGPIIYASIKLVWGKLWGITPDVVSLDGSFVTATWDAASLGNNGAATDKVFAVVYNTSTGLWYFADAEVLRSAAEITVTVADGLVYGNLRLYIWAAQYSIASPTLLQMVSDSTFSLVTAG